jgi:hypothetical protein
MSSRCSVLPSLVRRCDVAPNSMVTLYLSVSLAMVLITQSLLALMHSRADLSSSTMSATSAIVRLTPLILTKGYRCLATICFTSSRWVPVNSDGALPQFSESACGAVVHRASQLFSHSILANKRIQVVH